ncbi:hypothetical protein [Aliiroseovarius sp. S253]|uniref:hypothetical protein n=1 Tax=Aliiroseovarius sp. S253 TaxID=3415133 RepID=UPI003C7A8230
MNTNFSSTGALRDGSGRFTGQGAFDSGLPAPMTKFTTLTEVDGDLREALEGAYEVLASCAETTCGVATVVCRASPGAGKSRLARLLMSEKARRGDECRVSFHLPTLDLAEEAANEACDLGLKAQAIRGRSAKRQDGLGTMCVKVDLVERASRLGIGVRDSFCRRVEEDGNEIRCQHFSQCAYLQQFRTEAEHAFLATNYLSLPDPVEKCDLRIVDETFWQQFLSIRDVPVAAFTEPRTFFPRSMACDHADLLDAAKQVAAALIGGASPLSLSFSSEDYSKFAALEWQGKAPDPNLAPDQSGVLQDQLLKRAEFCFRQVSRFAAIWSVLAAAKEAGLSETERLRLRTDGERYLIRVLRRKELYHSEPMLVLDADADDDILSALGCDVRTKHEVALRPNAKITQLHDRRMTNGSLLTKPGIRETWRQIIAREVLIDKLGHDSGVLVGATRKVVRAFFEDAGHSFDGMTEEQVSEFMLETKLQGADWLWFGGRALGSNRYKDCSSVVVMGREELPVTALEDQARALWGDTPGMPLDLIEPDETGLMRMPAVEVAYEMADGSAKAVQTPCHPDRRVRRLQLQSREYSSRQLIERLRLARSSYRKRVLIGCNIPIPGMPVDELISWQDLSPHRIEAAVTDGLLEKGGIRLSPDGLVHAAPKIFTSLEAARTFLKRHRPQKEFNDGRCRWLCDDGRIGTISFKRKIRYAREETAILFFGEEGLAENAERLWGSLRVVDC